ncbi:MAG: efflux RND transporter periplasmic adaptor subunit [Achromobacter sp.]|uniref:efflux RND transporter periplasmic adaptor subunit n=1 Tax=Achromobacter sp. TaxID=134375 RepID=UPI003CFC86D0
MVRRPLVPFAFCLLPLILAACGDSPPRDPRGDAPLVRAALVRPAATESRSFSGVVAARVQSELAFRVAGKVLERLVDTGQTVKRGQALMRLDPEDLALQARAQREAVAAARARARQAVEDETRYRGLVAEGAVSASAYDRIKAAADTARADLKAAEAQADVASNASGYAVLLADADCVIVDTLAEPGQVVSAGQPVVRLARAGQREAIVHLPETLRPAVGSVARATLYGARTPPAPAVLRQLSDAADRVTRTFEARYVLEEDLAHAPLGATVTVDVPDGAPTERLLQVPIGAVFDAGAGPGVWVIEGTPAQVARRSVQVHGLSDDIARVGGDLKAGERVVALGAHLLRDGEKVRLIGQDDTPAAGERQ